MEKLVAHEKELEQNKLTADAQLQEAQRQADQVEFQLNTAKEQLREAEDQVLRLQGTEKQHEVLLQAILDAETAARKEREDPCRSTSA